LSLAVRMDAELLDTWLF